MLESNLKYHFDVVTLAIKLYNEFRMHSYIDRCWRIDFHKASYEHMGLLSVSSTTFYIDIDVFFFRNFQIFILFYCDDGNALFNVRTRKDSFWNKKYNVDF